MMLLQFINAYSETLELKDVYPHGISFDMLEHALVEREVAGMSCYIYIFQISFTLLNPHSN